MHSLTKKKNLEEKDKRHQSTREQLIREQNYLRERLGQLQDNTSFIQYPTMPKRRSISECSSGVSSTSSNSEPETSETTELFESNENGMICLMILFMLNIRIFFLFLFLFFT